MPFNFIPFFSFFFLKSLENQIYQFFVKSEDQGEPKQVNQVPVEILVMGRNDTAPSFPVPRMLYFIKENERVCVCIIEILTF